MGSSIIILNALKDIKNSHLYSIEINNSSHIGICVKKYFQNLANKWTLFKGNIAAKYIEEIGNNIDLAMIDTSHFEPGEILDFLMILPFLKNKAIVIIHDIDLQITSGTKKDMRYSWAPYIIFNLIMGKKVFPSGKGILNKNIGAIKLEGNQKRLTYDYCRALAGQWQYFLSKEQIKIITSYFKKYYSKECLIILNETIIFNREFVNNNPREDLFIRLRRERNKEKLIKKNSTILKK